MNRKVEPSSALANILKNLSNEYEKVETVASGMLGILKNEKVHTLEAFTALMEAAYKANGWQMGGGRPKEGTITIPTVVRVYVSTIRSGYRHDLEVWDYESITALREDLRKERARILRQSAPPGASDSDLPGLELLETGTLIGSVFHDLIVVHETLGDEDKAALEASLDRLLKKYAKGVDLPFKTPNQPQVQASARVH